MQRKYALAVAGESTGIINIHKAVKIPRPSGASKSFKAEIVIETDLHEWLANKSYIYEPDENAENSYHEFVSMGGNYADGREKDWEDLTAMRKRVLRVLEKYSSYDKVAVACHGMIIQSVCHGYHPANGEIVELNPNIFR